MDRAIRIYLAHLIDEGELSVDRTDYEIGILIPPEGWVEEHIDPPMCDPVDDVDCDGEIISISVPPAVNEMIDEADEQGVVESKSKLVIDAHEWLCNDGGN